MDAFLQALEPHWRPHAGQKEFLRQPAKIKVLACGRRWGKTDVCAVETLFRLTNGTDQRCMVIAPTQDQANILFERVVALAAVVYGEIAIRDRRASPHPKLTLMGSVLTARSGHLEHTLRGREATAIVVDEAAFLPESVVTDVAMPMLATSEGSLTLISTPNGRNHFYRFYDLGQQGKHGIWSRTAPSIESPWVSERYLAIQRELVSARAFRVEYEASFEDSEGRVFRTEDLESCLTDRLPSIEGSVSIGIDLAQHRDFCAIVVLKGRREQFAIQTVERWNRVTWEATLCRIADIIEPFPDAMVLVDATAMGSHPFEALQRAFPSRCVRGVHFTAAIKKELIDNLAWAVERRHLVMRPHIELLKELQHFETTVSDQGHRRYEARHGYHDDLVIALALAASGLGSSVSSRVLLGDSRSDKH